MSNNTYIDPTALVENPDSLGDGVRIWNWTKVRSTAKIGDGTSVGQCAYIDADVTVGHRCKIQNGVQVYKGVTVGDDVFIGPNVTFTNDKYPRANNADWKIVDTIIADGASIGAGSVIVCGIRIGKNAMIGAGSLVARDIPDNAMAVGNPAKIVGFVDSQGKRTGAKQ